MSKMAQAMVEQRPSFMPASAGLLQRKCDKCRKKKQLLQRSSAQQAKPSIVPPIVHKVLRSSGQPLDKSSRAFFEPRFGHNFGKVRVHTDNLAAKSAQSIAASAYTAGQDIVFGPGKYAPKTSEGKLLLAHELAHITQGYQGCNHARPYDRGISSPNETLELEADEIAKRVVTEQHKTDPETLDMQKSNELTSGKSIFIQREESYEETNAVIDDSSGADIIEGSDTENINSPGDSSEKTDDSPPGDMTGEPCYGDDARVPMHLQMEFFEDDGTEVFCTDHNLTIPYEAYWYPGPKNTPNTFQAQLKSSHSKWLGQPQTWELGKNQKSLAINGPGAYWIHFKVSNNPDPKKRQKLIISGDII